MDERKLNINAPLMSVRHCYATSKSLTKSKRKILEKQHTLPWNKSDMTLDQVTDPVAVPFNWEHIPGRCKGISVSESQSSKEASITPIPCLPPGKSISLAKLPFDKECNVARKFGSSSCLSGSVIKTERDERKQGEKIRSGVEEDDDNDDYDDDVYSDALETLSPTESFSMNCSVSGLDDLYASNCGTFSSDKKTQDLMMSRFLPAAKAMTIQPLQYSSRKQSVQVEQLRDVTKLVLEEKKSFVDKPITHIVPYIGQFQEGEENDSGDEIDDYEDSANISAKGCGFFPCLHTRNSLCLLKPVSEMKMRKQFSISSNDEVGKSNRSSHIRSYSPAPAIKKAWDAINKSKSSSGDASSDVQDARKKWTSGSNRFVYSGELKHSSFRRSTASGSSFRSIPQPLPRGARLGDFKQSGKLKFPSQGHSSIQEVHSHRTEKSSNSRSLEIENTLYINSESTAKSSFSKSNSVDNTKGINTLVAALDKRDRKDIKSFQDMKQVQAVKENLDSEVLSSVDSNSSTLSSMLHFKAKAERLSTDQGSFDEDKNTNNLQMEVYDDSGKVLPPPLPKSPSESWLYNTLPLVSLKNSKLHSSQVSQFHAKRQGSNTSSRYTKWETVVKASNLHHDHVCSSQELTIYKSQHSKS